MRRVAVFNVFLCTCGVRAAFEFELSFRLLNCCLIVLRTRTICFNCRRRLLFVNIRYRCIIRSELPLDVIRQVSVQSIEIVGVHIYGAVLFFVSALTVLCNRYLCFVTFLCFILN